MKKLLLITLLMVCALNAGAQTYLEHLQAKEAGMGKVTVHQSKALDELINGTKNERPNNGVAATPEKKTDTTEKVGKTTVDDDIPDDVYVVDTSKKIMRGGHKVSGYRVQVYAGGNSRNDKAKAERIGNEIKALFPGQPVYVHFYSPRWICRMGNYRTYEEGQAMLTRVKSLGYTQASLVKGQITVKD